MADDPVQMDTTDMTETSVETPMPLIGCHEVITPRGTIHYCEAMGVMASAVHGYGDHRPATSVGLMTYIDPCEHRPKGKGLIAQLDPANARTIAASLVQLAHEVESQQRPRADGMISGAPITNEMQQIFGPSGGGMAVTGIVVTDDGISVTYGDNEVVVQFQPVITAYQGGQPS